MSLVSLCAQLFPIFLNTHSNTRMLHEHWEKQCLQQMIILLFLTVNKTEKIRAISTTVRCSTPSPLHL